MALPTGGNDDVVRILLDIDSRAAINELDKAQATVAELSQAIQTMATKSGANFRLVAEEIKTAIRTINSERARLTIDGVPTDPLKVTSLQVSEALKLANIQAGELVRLMSNVGAQERIATINAEQLASSLALASKNLGVALSPEQISAVANQLKQLSQLDFQNVSKYQQNVSSLMNNVRVLSQQTGISFQELQKYIQGTFKNVDANALREAIRNLNAEVKGLIPSVNRARGEFELLGKSFTAQEFAPVFQQLQQLNQLDFSNVKNYTQSFPTLMNSIRELSQITGKSFEEVGAYIGKTFNIGELPIKNAVTALNAELSTTNKLITNLEAMFGKTFSPQQASGIVSQFQKISQLDFSTAQASGQSLNVLMGSMKTLSQQTGASFQTLGNYIQQTFQNVPPQVVNQAVTNLNNQLKQATQSGKGLNNILRLIRGTLVAMGVFRVFQFISDSIHKAEEAAIEFEQSLYRLVNTEKILSRLGTEISMEGLKRGIQDIKRLLPIFSEADITQQISLIGIMTKDLGYQEEQIIDLAKAIGVLNIRSAEQEDLLATTQKILTAIVAPTGRGIASLGIDLGADALRAEALAEGLLQAGDSLDDLSEKQTSLLKLNIILKNAGEELINIDNYLNSNTAQIQEQAAAWEDTLKVAGQAWIGLKATTAPFFVAFFNWLSDGIQGLKAISIIVEALGNEFRAFAIAVGQFLKNPIEFIKNWETISGQLADVFVQSLGEGFNRLFSGAMPADAPQWFQDLFGQFAEDADTATAEVDKFGNAIQSVGEIEGFDKLIEDIQKLQEKLQEAADEFDQDWAGAKEITVDIALNLDIGGAEFQALGREVQDYVLKVQRLVQDYAIRRAKVEQDANDAIADANAKYHEQQISEEARFQEQLRQLQASYLLNLEDALHERDARQVLRLQKQYALDKEALENEHKLREEEAARQHALDLARIRRERDERLAELAAEEQLRLARERQDFELRQQRAEEDFQQEQEKLKQQLSERLQEFATAFGEEYNLNEQRVQDLYDLLNKYYGPDGIFDRLYEHSKQEAINSAQEIVNAINQIIQAISYLPPSLPSILQGIDPYYGATDLGGQAEGGTYLATRPTTATFGESGPEIAQFIPLRSNMIPSALGATGGGEGVGGEIRLLIDLSPDLESRIIDKSLNNVSAVIRRVENER